MQKKIHSKNLCLRFSAGWYETADFVIEKHCPGHAKK